MQRLSRRFLALSFLALTIACGKSGEKRNYEPRAPLSQAPAQDEKLTKDDILENGGTRSVQLGKSDLETAESELIPYELPKEVEERIEPEDFKPVSSRSFSLTSPHLRVDLGRESMLLTGTLQVTGTKDEAIKMSCQFDRTQLPISCDDMFPTDPKIASQRRLQATAMCMNMAVNKDGKYVCTELVLRFYARINGKNEFQHFESKPTHVSRAHSGHEPRPISIPDDVTTPPKIKDRIQPEKPSLPTPVKKKKDQSRIVPEVTPNPHEEPVPTIKDEEPLPIQVEEEIPEDSFVQDESDAIEVDGPTQTPSPKADAKYSIVDIEKVEPLRGNIRPQAYKMHNNGQLFHANQLKSQAAIGVYVRPATEGWTSFATDTTVKFVTDIMRATTHAFPNRPPMVVGDISQKGGAKLKNHSSHQTGLDIDISYPAIASHHVKYWEAANSSDFDLERFMYVAETIACAEGAPAFGIFVNAAIKKRACAYAKKAGKDITNPQSCSYKALRHMFNWGGHTNHFHVRLKCPGNPGCQDTPVYPPRGKWTGC